MLRTSPSEYHRFLFVSQSPDTGLSVAKDVKTTLLYDLIHTNVSNAYDSSTGEWTCPSAGAYLIHASAYFQPNNNGNRFMDVVLNGDNQDFDFDPKAILTSTGVVRLDIAVPLTLAVDDVITFTVKHDSNISGGNLKSGGVNYILGLPSGSFDSAPYAIIEKV